MHRTARQLMLAAAFLVPSSALAQNGLPRWEVLGDGKVQTAGPVSPASIRGNQLLVWHRDGADRPPVLALVDRVTLDGSIGGMLTWDGVRWELYPLPAPGATIGRSIVFDFDGDGPEPERVVAITTGVAASRVVFWNGADWEPLPGWIEAGGTPYGALGVVDFDGPGGQPARLVGANQSVQVWVGSAWANVGAVGGTVASYGVTTLEYFDPDGAGGLQGYLYMGGNFTSVAGVTTGKLARWNGTAWSSVPGITMSGVPGTMVVHDFDGEGAGMPELVVAGQMSALLGQTGVAAYGGVLWRSVGAGSFDVNNSSTPPNLSSVASAGVGQELLVYGAFHARGATQLPQVGTWNSATGAFAALSSAPGAGFDGDQVHSIVAADLDGDGPAPVSLFATGSFTTSGGHAVGSLVRWNGREWQPISIALDDQVQSILVADLDGPGPQPERTYIAGRFFTAGNATCENVAQFDGVHLSPVGVGPHILTHDRTHLAAFDPDASGPENASLFLTAGNTYRWYGGDAWSLELVGGYASCLHDFDGQGPAPARLVQGGNGSVSPGLIRQYDGFHWSGVGSTPASGLGWTVASFDHDGSDATPAYLYAAGPFRLREDQPLANTLAYYDGASWNEIAPGYQMSTSNMPLDMVAFDIDGEGPIAEALVMGGRVSTSFPDVGGVRALVTANNSFVDLGALSTDELEVFDADGEGPGEPRLIAVGEFADYQGVHFGRIAQWNVRTLLWEPMYDGCVGVEDGRVQAVAVERPWGPRGPQRLALGGSFTRVDDQDAVRMVHYSNVGRPWCLESPEDAPIFAGQPIVLRARVSAAYAGATFQWRQSGAPLHDGPGPLKSSVTGAAGTLEAARGEQEITIELRVEGGNDYYIGIYDVVLSNAAGDGVSDTAVVGAMNVCPADFNRDRVVNTQDFFDFITAFFGSHPSADFNGDFSVNSQDFFDFLAAFFTGCP